MFSRDVRSCLRKRVSVNVGWCGVLWLLSFLCVWYVFDNVSCTYSDVLYMSLHIPGSMCVGVALWWCGIRMQAEALLVCSSGMWGLGINDLLE